MTRCASGSAWCRSDKRQLKACNGIHHQSNNSEGCSCRIAEQHWPKGKAEASIEEGRKLKISHKAQGQTSRQYWSPGSVHEAGAHSGGIRRSWHGSLSSCGGIGGARAAQAWNVDSLQSHTPGKSKLMYTCNELLQKQTCTLLQLKSYAARMYFAWLLSSKRHSRSRCMIKSVSTLVPG